MPQADVECQLLRNHPLVLKVSEKRILPQRGEGSRQVASIFIRQIEQETGEGVGESWTRAAVQRSRTFAKDEKPARTVGLSLQQVVSVVANVSAPLQRMVPEDSSPVAD